MPLNSVINNEESNEIEKKIKKIRKVFLEDYELNSKLYDECDVQRVRQYDWIIRRYLISNKLKEDMALKNLTETFQWRKSFGVNTRTDDYFPNDFYKIGGIFRYGTDKNGLPLLYFRVCVHHKVTELSELIKEFFVHEVNKIDFLSSGEWAVVFDCSNSGISNVDMDFARFMTQVLEYHFAKGFKYLLIYEMPWIMLAFWKITRAFISDEVKEYIKSANGIQIFDFIDAENVPEYIPGGKCTKSINVVPEGVKSAEELPHLNFTEEQIKRLRTIFNLKEDECESPKNGNDN